MTITHASITNVNRRLKKYCVVINDSKMDVKTALKNFQHEGEAILYLQELGYELVTASHEVLYFKKVVTS